MGFTEEWFSEAAQTALADLVTQVRALDGRIIEIGCWEGRSTCALANACYPAEVQAVDTWMGSPGEPSWKLAHERDILKSFLANVDELTNGNVVPHQEPWRKYVLHDTSPVRFLHIDAEHSYREVADTIASFRPMMADGGIMCGDDAHHPPVITAALEAFPQAEVITTLWWVRL